MGMNMKKKWVSLVAGAGLALAATTALAIPTVRIQDGNTGNVLYEVADNTAEDLNSTVSGLVVVEQSFGPWFVNAAFGITKPLTGSAAQPHMFFDSVHFSFTGSAPLDPPDPLLVSFSDTDYTGVFPGFTTNTGGFTDGEVLVASFYDPGNILFGTTGLLASLGPFSGDFAASSGNGIDPNNPLTGPYSLTLAALINHPEGLGTTQLNMELQPVPEPGTILLLGIGMLGILGLAGFRRLRTN